MILSALKGLSLKAWGYIIAVAAAVAVIAKAYSAGKTAERAATNEKNLGVKDEQLKAAARRPRDRRQLIERLRGRRF